MRLAFRYYIKRAQQLPLHALGARIATKIIRAIMYWGEYCRDHIRRTHSNWANGTETTLYSYFGHAQAVWLIRKGDMLEDLGRCYLEHRFNLLGSGWVQVRYGMKCSGLERWRYETFQNVEPDEMGLWLNGRINRANAASARAIWHLVDHDYAPIDWQRDFKSGFRWEETTWFRRISYGNVPGADVKVPWELARMQHLPQLAMGYRQLSEDRRGERETYVREFQNQILDFIALNPPRFGVNWSCTMDVAIRAVNWLVAYDLFTSACVRLDNEFKRVLVASIWDHARHIVDNLEWNDELRGNHYLANVIGLLFISAYLPRTSDTDVWLAFSVQELISEVGRQFYGDGGSFEGSTSYHRLAAEMVVYATALILSLSDEKHQGLLQYEQHRWQWKKPMLRIAPLPMYELEGVTRLTPFPKWYFERIERMAEFVINISKPDGTVPQIGDNDNGRFLKLGAKYQLRQPTEAKQQYGNLAAWEGWENQEPFWDEDHLDQRHVAAAVTGIIERPDFAERIGDFWFEREVIQMLARGVKIASYRSRNFHSGPECVRVGRETTLHRAFERWKDAPSGMREILDIYVGQQDECGIRFCGYPEFGLYLYRSNRLYLAIRCGRVGQNGFGGHAHNDQLSIELSVDGVNMVRDPGTYLYTPLPQRRNEYRSVQAHFAPQLEDIEPSPLDVGVFYLGNQSEGECIYFGERGFVGKHYGYKAALYRVILFQADRIRIADYLDQDDCQAGAAHIPAALRMSGKHPPPYSKGYGIWCRESGSGVFSVTGPEVTGSRAEP